MQVEADPQFQEIFKKSIIIAKENKGIELMLKMLKTDPQVQEIFKKSIIVGKIINKAIENKDIELMLKMLKKNKEMLMEIHFNMEEIIFKEQIKDNEYLEWCNRMKKVNDILDFNIMKLKQM